MKVKETTLVITDPCYVKNTSSARAFINESTIYGDWTCMCYKCDKEKAKEKSEEWNSIYFDFFKKYNSETNSDLKETLYQDFYTKKQEFVQKNCYGEFCADSGQVAVYDYDELDEEDKKWIKEHTWCACIIPNYTGEIKYTIEDREAHIVGDDFYTTQSGL